MEGPWRREARAGAEIGGLPVGWDREVVAGLSSQLPAVGEEVEGQQKSG